MKIKVSNIRREQIKRKELVYFSEWASKRLMGPRLCKNIYLEVSFVDMDELGMASALDDEYKPREFEIYLQKGMDREDIIGTLGHELVHVKQFARRELTNFDCRNKPVYAGTNIDIDGMDYFDYPWEIEAYGRAVGLLARYKEHIAEFKLIQRLTK